MDKRTRIDRVGEQKLNNQGCLMTIVKYNSTHDIDVRFSDQSLVCNKNYCEFKKGTIRNPKFRSIYNVGYIGEGIFSKKYNSKLYAKWNGMFYRCYSSMLPERYHTYSECIVDVEWHCLQNFGEWYEINFKPWMDETWDIDKDILIKGNKIYSSQTCALVPKEINSIFTKSDKMRGKYPIGVTLDKRAGRYVARCQKGGKLSRHIGNFPTELEAFQAYKEAKENYIKEVAEKWRWKIDERVYQAMMNYQVDIND